MTVNRGLCSVQQISLSTVLVLTYSDGTVEFRDRTTMDVLPRDETMDQVSSLGQVGFDFPDTGPRKHDFNNSRRLLTGHRLAYGFVAKRMCGCLIQQ